MFYANCFNSCSQTCKAGTLDPKKVIGKILVCLREYNDNERTQKGQQTVLAGAIGMILINDKISGNDVVADPHVLPVSHINFTDGEYVFDYIKSTKHVSYTFTYNILFDWLISEMILITPSWLHNRTPMGYMTRVRTELETKPAPLWHHAHLGVPISLSKQFSRSLKQFYPNFHFFFHSQIALNECIP